MAPFADNPFAVLTTVVAPAVLTNACSVLCLGTSNRIARVIDRGRVVAGELDVPEIDGENRRNFEDQLVVLRARAGTLFWCLRCFYLALGSFALAALVALLRSAAAAMQHAAAFEAAAVVGIAAGVVGVSSVSLGCALMLKEVQLTLKQIGKEAEPLMRMMRRDRDQG